MSDIISVEHLAYTYPGVEDTPGVPVFADLNLTIEEGSFVAVLGTNGCGKSTLAKHFNAILLPSGGKVYFWEFIPLVLRKERYAVEIRQCRKSDIMEIDNYYELAQLDSTYRTEKTL